MLFISTVFIPSPISMDAQHEVMGSYRSNSTGEGRAVIKSRRTKRNGALPPLPSAPASIASSSTSSAEESGFTDEEEDMANCLILLAQGGGGPRKFTTRRITEAATTSGGRGGFYVYECKTCNRCFPSFQALGGHRASHKKLKMVAAMPPEEKKGAVDECNLQMSMNSCLNPNASAGTGAATGGKTKVHECSICGMEFSSGQALGGHMRRHRPAIPPEELKKEKNVLSLDLNLPAPADEENPFAIAGKPPVLPPTVAAALVGCHY